MTADSIWLLAIVGLPLLGAVVLGLSPRAIADRIAPALGVLVTGIALLLSVIAILRFDRSNAGSAQLETDINWIPALGSRLHLGVDGVSLPLVVLTTLLTFLCLLYSLRHLPGPGRPRAFVAVLLVLEVGMVGTFVALDLLLFFVFFEVVLVPMWFLIAVWGGEGRRTAADTFILYTLLGSAVMLLGFLLIGLRSGTFDIPSLVAAGGEALGRGAQVAAFLAVGLGFAVKTPMWPLHSWLPAAHTAAPTVGSVLLAGVLLKMGTYGFVRIAIPMLPDGARLVAPWLAAFGVVGIVYGGWACLAQRDLKRLVAFSSVGHMGFVLLGIATLTSVGINGALFGNIAHGLITGLLFFLVGAIKDRHGSSDLARIGRGMYARAPVLGALLAFGAVASLGLPGLAGFWGEMLALLGAYQPALTLDRNLFLVLMVVAGLGTVLAAAYLLRVVRRVDQGDVTVTGAGAIRDATPLELVTWSPIVALVVVLGLVPGLLLTVTTPAVEALLGGVP